MKKKIVVTAATLALAAMLAACGGKEEGEADPTKGPVPTETPTPMPQVNVEEQIQEAYEAVKTAFGGDYGADLRVEEEETYMNEVFGLQPEWYDAAIAEIPMMSAKVDTLIIVHATEGNLDNVKNALTGYQDYLTNDAFQYPSNQLKVQGSLVETIGNYVCFSLLGFPDDTQFADESDLIAEYQRLNKMGMDAIRGVVGE